MKRIRKAVLPVAGLGTRFLPATKAVPKEMMCVVDRPVVQHVVDEARAAGIEHFIFVTGRNKAVIEDHFDIAYELNRTLAERGKTKELEALARDQPKAGADQLHPPAGAPRPRPCGLVRPRARRRRALRGDPARHAQPRLHGADDRRLRQAWRQHHRRRGSAGGPDAPIRHRLGRPGIRPDLRDHRHGRKAAARAPRPRTSSSRAATSCSREIFDLLSNQESGAGNEIQLTDSMIRLMKEQPFFGMKYEGRTYDTGSKIGFLMANVAYALEREESRPAAAGNSRRCCARNKRAGVADGFLWPLAMLDGPPWQSQNPPPPASDQAVASASAHARDRTGRPDDPDGGHRQRPRRPFSRRPSRRSPPPPAGSSSPAWASPAMWAARSPRPSPRPARPPITSIPAEASHGDLGMIQPDDVILALSWSGETADLPTSSPIRARFRVPLIALTVQRGIDAGPRGRRLPGPAEGQGGLPERAGADHLDHDAAGARRCARDRAAGRTRVHGGAFPRVPSGRQARRASQARARHHAHGERLPIVGSTPRWTRRSCEIGRKGFGCVIVVNGDGTLAGIVTDGDLRRHLQPRPHDTASDRRS